MQFCHSRKVNLRIIRHIGHGLLGGCAGLLLATAASAPAKADPGGQSAPEKLNYFSSPSYACGPQGQDSDWYNNGVPYPCPAGISSTRAASKAAREVYHDLMKRAWVDGDLTALEDYIVEDSYDYSPLHPPEKGTKGFAGIITAFRSALSGIKLEHSDVAEGDIVTHFWKLTGVHDKGPLFGSKPDGKTVTLSGISAVRVKDGKVVDRWSQLDIYGLLVQLGTIPKIL